jgi:hypothetical protein
MILVYGEQGCVVNRLGVVTVHVYADYVFNSRNVRLSTIIWMRKRDNELLLYLSDIIFEIAVILGALWFNSN